MESLISPNGIPILGQNKIVVTVVPGGLADTFDVQIDTSAWLHGVPLAVQCLLQAAMSLIPVAYQQIADATKGINGSKR